MPASVTIAASVRRWLGAALALSMLMLAPPLAFARMLGDTGVAYSADRTLSVNGQHFDGVVYAVPGMQRHEQMMAGIEQVAIFNLAAGRGYYIVPSVRTYIDFPIDLAVHELGMPDVLAAPVGTEPGRRRHHEISREPQRFGRDPHRGLRLADVLRHPHARRGQRGRDRRPAHADRKIT